MTTFTTKDREEIFIEVNAMDKFIFRFYKEGDEYVCRMPEWLVKEAQEVLK